MTADADARHRAICAQRPDGMAAGLSRGSAPSRYSILAMMQYPVAANQTIAPPTNTGRLICVDRSAVAVAPNWHLSLPMSCNYRAPIDDVGDFRERKFASVGLSDLGEVGRSGLQGVGQPSIPVAVDAVARHAGDFIFNNSLMRIVGSCLDTDPNENKQRKRGC